MTNHEQSEDTGDAVRTDRLGAALLREGLISEAQLQAANALQGDVGQALLDLGFIKEDQLNTFFVKAMKVPRINLGDYDLDPDTVKMLPQTLCEQYYLVPIDILGKNLTLAMVNPLNDEALDAVRKACPDYRIKSFLCTRVDFQMAARRIFKNAPRDDAAQGGMSLDSLGLKPSSAPRKPQPAPEQAPDDDTAETPSDLDFDEDGDAQKTMLFDSKVNPPVRASSAPLRSSLICLDGWELGREIEIAGESHTLGRSTAADTTIRSPLISREHARITRNAEYGQETFMITDLKSSNGTFVNNVPVTSTILRHGDRILLGNVMFKFVLLDEIEARFHKDVHHLYRIHKDTGLLPADAWRQELARAVAAAPEVPLSLALVGIDDLDPIRQAHGPTAGVVVLNDISDILGRYLETKDLPGDYGAGKFAILFDGKPLESVFPLVEDFRRTVEAHVFHLKDARFKCTVSVGVAAVTEPGQAPESAAANLEAALQAAIDGGQNQTSVAS